MGKTGQPITASRRLQVDRMQLAKDPVPYITAEPLPSNVLEWHYVVKGPEGSPYEGGTYHGKLVFPKEYPFKPPAIYMITPNGRFKTNTRLCLSISDFHPDTWNPGWSVSTILTGLLSFMLEKSVTLGSIETTDVQKRIYAAQSGRTNLKDKKFRELFPGLCDEIRQQMLEEDTLAQAAPPQPPVTQPNNTNIINFAVLVIFGVFAFVVRTMISSLN